MQHPRPPSKGNTMKERFMIVTYVLTRNGSYDELTDFKNRVSPRNLQQANVILDLKDQKVVKNSLNKKHDFVEILTMYRQEIGTQLDPYIAHLGLEFGSDAVEA
jgi:hypothetical protein